MKKKVYIGLAILLVLFSVYYYWENRYVELRAVILNDDVHRFKVFNRKVVIFQNDFYRIAERDETPPNFYKNIRFVLDHQIEDYIVKDGVIYIKYKYMNDLEMIWNYTTKTNDLTWIKQKKEEDIFNGNAKMKKN
ncbi:hypothetical protein KHA90_23795 [Flavobacterium psychroterrae]|uniref:Uncharacterized protein n=1 Tax=Flavobacterium psychroterrae TaxID=2133767 RepID=A0ABS5PI84_9FLAO|nr:hypothetical protein [Flavobacterium psychroterrae]MBS7234034.1 hypothetical protein [Flavobacterium psychroterrae]